ncbi:MAG: hypothetical protein A2161_16400 [Candidatus Schekmanbacteria bacterium RBG_13_48_7]|uniref:ABC transporter domain-containing protein n=1 Tax=Candidatus Schekmanbacteria bacterium RBG_13_48_7 TaxID=1817878 RepID=A0A1F7S2I5_9BACT|nr:MAG: hypothetical protein A2161_16400 [Candidatus Schekmanbacteria bacterium RBG_13_48_7]
MKSSKVVECLNVKKTFGVGTNSEFTAIRDLNFTVEDLPGKGEFIVILGPSGCGKSTVLRMIAGLEPHFPPTEGTIKVQGNIIKGPGPDRGMVFQDYTSFDNRSVIDNIVFGLECQGKPKNERYELGYQWVQKIGLNMDKDSFKYPYQLSGGMKQRVAIARTLILKPRIILMDEPFGALDPFTRMQMQDLLVELWHEVEATVFFVTHSIAEGVYLGDRIYILSTSPGTLKHEIEVPSPDRPSKEMQRDENFQKIVNDIREIIDNEGQKDKTL